MTNEIRRPRLLEAIRHHVLVQARGWMSLENKPGFFLLAEMYCQQAWWHSSCLVFTGYQDQFTLDPALDLFPARLFFVIFKECSFPVRLSSAKAPGS